LRARIFSELRLQLGRDFRLWQDTAAIPDGALWEDEIRRAISGSVFFIPIVTPSAVHSEHCRFEFDAFLRREAELGRSDLVFPVLYVTVEELEREDQWRRDNVLRTIGSRQYLDWRPLRHLEHSSTDVLLNTKCKALRGPAEVAAIARRVFMNWGDAYRDGEGAPQDYVQAHMWLNLAVWASAISRTTAQREPLRKAVEPASLRFALPHSRNTPAGG
jgi:hypothetical protein